MTANPQPAGDEKLRKDLEKLCKPYAGKIVSDFVLGFSADLPNEMPLIDAIMQLIATHDAQKRRALEAALPDTVDHYKYCRSVEYPKYGECNCGMQSYNTAVALTHQAIAQVYGSEEG